MSLRGRPLPATPRQYVDDDSNKKIRVRKLPKNVSHDTLELYFESKKNFGRQLTVQDVQLDLDHDLAIVTFETPKDAKFVLQKHRRNPCMLRQQELVVESCMEDEADESDSIGGRRSRDYFDKTPVLDTIEVRGFSDECSDDTLRFYFENKRRSGGGDITVFAIEREKGFAHITFKDKSVVQSVLERDHTLVNHRLSVQPFIISKTELLLEEVPKTVTEESLTNFVEAKFKIETTSITLYQDKHKAHVQFVKEFSFTKAQEVCKEFPLAGVHVVPVQVPASTGIIVTKIPEDVTHGDVEVYFENTQRSKGGETSKVELHADDGYCLVFFKNAEVVSRVCQKTDHKLHSKHVDVQPYNEYTNLPAATESSAFKFPKPITLYDLDPHKMKFLQTNTSQRSALDKELTKCRAKIFWDPISVECTIKKDDKIDRKLLTSWPEDTKKCIREFTNNLTVRKKSVDKSVLSEVRIQLSKLHLSHTDDVALIVEKENNQIVLVALKKEADSMWQEIVKATETAERLVKERKQSTTENKELDAWKIAYLKAAHFEDDMLKRYKNIQMRFEDLKAKGRIYLTGPKGTVQSVWTIMSERIENVKQQELKLEKEQTELLQNEKTIEKVKQAMKRKNVPDVWEVKPACVILYADEEDDLSKMESAINKTLAKYTISLDSGTEGILKSKKWSTTKQSLIKKFSGCVTFKEKHNQLEIFTLRDIQDEVSDELQSFLSKNARYKEEMTLTRHVVLYFKHVINDKFSKEVHALKSRGLNIDIHLNEDSGAVSLEGTSEGIKEGKLLITKMQDSIETKQHKISHPKVRKYFGSSNGKECVEKIEKNTPCIIDTQGAGFKRNLNNCGFSTYSNSKTCAETTLKSGVKVFVVGGDMTELQVDVLVNPANKELKHFGGLARVIVNKGGQDIQTECDNRIKTKGSLSDGDVFMSKGGKLNCKFVAHAVGPHWQGGAKNEELCLQKAIYSSIEKTEKKKLGSIAMPALSAGMFMYPVDRSCMAIVKALYQHFQETKSSIKEVYLCDISKATVAAFIKALQAIMPNVKVLDNISQGDGQNKALMISDDEESAGHSREPTGSVDIEVVKGLLTKEKTDVIVNTTAPDLYLQKGAVSKAILMAGGSMIQDECSRNYPNGIDVGEVAITTGGSLKCSNIYHITLRQFDNRNPRMCFQGITDCVTACLTEADSKGFKSVSFPAIGTGGQRYPKDKVAKEMFKAVSNFCKANPSSSVTNVRFLIYTEDDETFEAFVTEEKNWKSGYSQHGLKSSRQTNLKPVVGILVYETRGHAEFKIGGLKVDVHEGDITDDRSEAIVACCNVDLDLSKGAVTRALLKKGGDAIEQDCKQQKSTMKKEGIAITTAGKLRAKYIIHIDIKFKTFEWSHAVLSCLRIAEQFNISSLAFPALGTSIGCKPEDIAGAMCSAIADFENDNPKSLQMIRLVIFQQEMVSAFIRGIKSAITGHPPSEDRHQPTRRPSNHQDKKRQGQNDDDSDDHYVITIYAEDTDKAQQAIRSLETTVKAEWMEKELEDAGITRFTSQHVMDVEAMAKNSHVDVVVDRELGNIKLVGLSTSVLEVLTAIYSQLRNADKSAYMRDQAVLMSNIVKWFYLKEHKEFPFPDRVNLEVETAYRNKDKTVKIKDRSGVEYEIDFGNMTEYDIKNPNDQFPVIRRDLIAGASFEIPKNWQIMDEKENLKLVALNAQDPEYQQVLKEFKWTLGRNPDIVKIERIQNKTLYTQYAAKRKELNITNPKQTNNERMLWHGTADYAVPSINSHGFNRSYCGKNATAIGQGVYFAVNANYSDQPIYSPYGKDGNKRMYRCLVLTGKYCCGSSNMRVPPPINRSQPHILYDSVTNSTSNPNMFVVFNDTQAYPEHLITYK